MLRRLITPLLLSAVAAPLAAQSAEQGAFITRLGQDTVAVERFTRDSGTIRGELIERVPRTRVTQYTAMLGPDGGIVRLDASVRAPLDSSPRPLATVTLIMLGDSATQIVQQRDSSRTVRFATTRTAVPVLDFYGYALYQPYLTRLTAGDSLPIDLIVPGNPRPMESWLMRLGGDSVSIGMFGYPLIAQVKDGRFVSLDGQLTTDKVKVERVADVNIATLARQFASRDKTGQALGQLSPRDTTTATVAKAELLVDYGRPSVRGRKIFGGIVPWGEVWRTGANAATQFSTSKDLVIGDSTVPAGKYTLWTLPSPERTLLIVNRQTGQWGTEYDSTQDLIRIPLHRTLLADPVEQFTITLPVNNDQATLEFAWDRTRYWVPLRVKP
ncbi:MAG TPA: DUF2911 domain-containing protein [Gemmatimonadales bacterium]|nr:DUF2911 domain-containing protein [Gemmatimonadales bacterium]